MCVDVISWTNERARANDTRTAHKAHKSHQAHHKARARRKHTTKNTKNTKNTTKHTTHARAPQKATPSDNYVLIVDDDEVESVMLAAAEQGMTGRVWHTQREIFYFL